MADQKTKQQAVRERRDAEREARTAQRQARRAQWRAAQFGSSVGLLTLRVGLGGSLLAHGLQNTFGTFHGPGLAVVAKQFGKMGLRPGSAMAALAGAGMIAGGGALVLGLATPAAGAVGAASMAVAGWQHMKKGYFALDGGYEYPLLMTAAGAALILTGPGKISADAVTKQRLNRGWMRAAALVAAPLAAAAVILREEAQLEGDDLAAQVTAAADPAAAE
ncbi:MAG: DoxX family protein [Pseudoclavibacter sp.]|jgi:putative oxidoreductase